MFGKHKYYVYISFCKNCGSQKATSHTKHIREAVNVQQGK
jgi:hypothetical protein